MGCQNCGSSNGVPRGCKSNGTCSSGGCNKLPVFDWLVDIDLPNGQSTYDIVEIRFKNSRKEFFRNADNIFLQVGDVVVTDASPGVDVGVVSIVGELARIQVRKKNNKLKAHEAPKLLRKASKEDIEKWISSRDKEDETMFKARSIASELALKMKISDVEYQGDGSKATFYYTADERVDFRQLIRELADSFSIKVEMKQIGARQEAARLGGIGSCGRELCCSTWLTDFRSVSTASARYQQLSLNPQKLAGQCGKLKCCLNFELDVYVDALKAFPRADTKLITKKGKAFHVKTDVFRKLMWFMYDASSEGGGGFVPLQIERVHEIIAMNKEGDHPIDLKDFMVAEPEKEPDYTNVVGQDSLNRFEHVFKRKKKKKSNKNQNNRPQNNNGQKANPNQKKNAQKANPNQNKQGQGQAVKGQNNKPNPNQKKKNPNQKNTNPNQKKNAQKANPNQNNNQNKPKGDNQTDQPKKRPNPRPKRKPKPSSDDKKD